MLDKHLKMELWDQDGNPNVSIEMHGNAGVILALMETGVEECIRQVADELSGDATLQAKMIDSTIKLLYEHKQMILRCAKAPEKTKKEPAKRMTPEEFSDYYNAWMSQAPLAEKNRFLDLQMSQLARKVVESYLA